MKIFLTLILLASSAQAFFSFNPPTTVKKLDANAYQGKWYEIAKMPNWFQRVCARDTTATYRLLPNGRIEVINRCKEIDGSTNGVLGEAKATDTSGAKLKVAFFKFLGQWNYWFSGDYWVLNLGPKMSYSLVGSPNRNFGWVLARTPQLSRQELRQIDKQLAAQGYNSCDFVMTLQKGGIQTPERLCDLIK